MFSSEVHVQNDRDDALILYLEPWAQCWKIQVGHCMQFVGIGPEEGCFKVRWVSPFCIVVEAWAKSTVKVYYDGIQEDAISEAFPALDELCEERTQLRGKNE